MYKKIAIIVIISFLLIIFIIGVNKYIQVSKVEKEDVINEIKLDKIEQVNEINNQIIAEIEAEPDIIEEDDIDSIENKEYIEEKNIDTNVTIDNKVSNNSDIDKAEKGTKDYNIKDSITENNKEVVQEIKPVEENKADIRVEQTQKQEKIIKVEQTQKQEENISNQDKTEETKKVYTYEQNQDESNLLKNEFLKLTNNNPNFSVEINIKAKNGYCFYPYRESEIKKQIVNISFGNFYVYAENVFLDGQKQRTNYYINFK